MGFSFGAGLSGMGASVASTAQTMVLENQRDALLTRQTQLANDLATKRELAVGAQQQAAAQTLESGREAAEAANIATQQTGETTRQSAQIASTEKISKAEIAARSADVAAQIAAQSKEVSLDANSGNAVIIDKRDGSVTPILGPGGAPFQPPNPELARLAIADINSVNEQLRAMDARRAIDIKSAQDDVDKTSQRVDLFGKEKDQAIAAAKQHVQDVQNHYDTGIADLHQQMRDAAAQLYKGKPVGSNATPAATPAATGTQPTVIQYDKQGQRIGAAPAPAASFKPAPGGAQAATVTPQTPPTPGLINTPQPASV